MTEAVYLSRPAVASSLGEGLAQHVSALLGKQNDYLTYRDTWVAGQSFLFGEFSGVLRTMPDDLPIALNSRNNQLLWHTLAQIEDEIQAAIGQYGADRIAVVLGTSTTGGDENQAAFARGFAEQDWPHSGFNQGVQLLSSPADFVAHVYGLGHVHYAISTACTSGSRALISAARLLRLGICDAVICGGVDTLSRLTINGFDALEVLSSGQCQPFSAHRDGINIGEASAIFVMTKDNKDGLPLLGYGASSDAYHMSSPRPDAKGAQLAIQAALDTANMAAVDLAWVNLHGTGTVQNDAMEALAINTVLGEAVSCASTKALTGHTLGAAGALEAAFLWAVMSEQYNPQFCLPPHRADFALDEGLAKVHLTQSGETYLPTQKRCALSTSFAFGGNNTALIIGNKHANPDY